MNQLDLGQIQDPIPLENTQNDMVIKSLIEIDPLQPILDQNKFQQQIEISKIINITIFAPKET